MGRPFAREVLVNKKKGRKTKRGVREFVEFSALYVILFTVFIKLNTTVVGSLQ